MKIDKPEVLSVTTGDVNIQYLLYNGNGPVLIFLHATGFLPWLWHPMARELSDSYKIIAPYFCDHRTAEPETGLSWGMLAQDFANLCESLKIEKPFLVGHSMGGSVATIAAGALGIEPEGMLLIEPIFLPEDFYKIKITIQDHPLASKSIKRRNTWEDENEAKAYLKSKKLFSSWNDEILDLYIEYGMKPGENGGLELTCSPRREASLFMGSRHYNPWPILKNISCPVKVIAGGNSDTAVFVNFKETADAFTNSEYSLINDAGHLIPMEKPGEIIKIIRDSFC